MLEHIQTALEAGPKRIAGITFSERLLRYIFFEKRNGIYTLGSWGEVTIAFDVMQQGQVALPIEFTKHVKSLGSVIPFDTRICIKQDMDSHKIQSLSLAGYKDVRQLPLPEALSSVYLPVGVDSERVCCFVTAESLTIFLYDHDEFHKCGVVSLDEKEKAIAIISELLVSCENKRVLFVGQGEEFISHIRANNIIMERSDIFQNMFDVTRYIPELPQADSYRYTVPTALVSFALHFQTGMPSKKGGTLPREASSKEIGSVYAELEPLTKSKDDARKASTKKPTRKYKKLHVRVGHARET